MKRMIRMAVAWFVALGLAFVFSSAALAKKGGSEVSPGHAKKQAASAETHHEGHHEKHHDKKGHDEAYEGHDAPAGTPPGWSHGKKTGWHGSPYPPGWSKWDKKKQDGWTRDRDYAHTEIIRVYDRYRIPEPKRNEITSAFNEAIAGGLIINDAKDRLVRGLENEDTRRNLMIDSTQSTLELLKK